MFTRAFWKDAAERVVATAAQAALLSIGAEQLNLLEGGLLTHLGFAGGGAVLSLLKALAAGIKDPRTASLVDLPAGRHVVIPQRPGIGDHRA